MAHTEPLDKLTKNQKLVMQTLSNAGGPLSAYTILDQLREKGFRAPLQVYRALDKLLEFGLIHRLESLNAFVACRQRDCDNHAFTAFMICDACGAVAEISDAPLARQLRRLAKRVHFAASKTTVEFRGACEACRD